MIKDPVFADMLTTPEEEQDQPAHDHVHDGEASASTHSHAHSHQHPTASSKRPSKAAKGENDLAQDKIRSTLRSMVRDWAEEGRAERDACYTPILDTLERSFPTESTRSRASRKVLVPGCGLGRLAMEIASRGGFMSRNITHDRFLLSRQ